VPDWLALVGDSADGYPGIPGWGAKTAAAVLARYGTVDAIPDDARAWDVPGIRSQATLAGVLREHRDEARLFVHLATAVTDIDVGAVDEWEWNGPTERFGDFADRIGAPGLAKRADDVALRRR
jgi:5'-3' exonuclease